MLEILSTRDLALANGVNIAVFGPAGTGKTRMCATTGDLDNTLIISVERESGLLSLREYDIPTVRVASMADMHDAYELAASGRYTWVCLDSVSEIASMILNEEKTKPENITKGGEVNMMWVYGALKTRLIDLLTAFKLLPVNTYFTFEVDAFKANEHAPTRLRPSVPGGAKDKLAHIFDIVAMSRIEVDEKGAPYWTIQCWSDGASDIKDRTGCLARFEKQDLASIFNKLQKEDK